MARAVLRYSMMLRPRHPGFFEEIGSGDIEILGDSRLAKKFFDVEIDISDDVTLFKRPTTKRAPPRLPKKREPITNVRPIPEALLRSVRERARTSMAPRAAVADAADETPSGIRRAAVLPWPAALMVLAVLAAVLVPHARRGDTRAALLYTLTSTRTAMKTLRHPSALLAAAPETPRDVKAVRSLRPAKAVDEYLTITFAAPAVKPTPPPEPAIAASSKAKPAVAKSVVAKSVVIAKVVAPKTETPAAPPPKAEKSAAKTPRAEAAKADALVRAQLE